MVWEYKDWPIMPKIIPDRHHLNGKGLDTRDKDSLIEGGMTIFHLLRLFIMAHNDWKHHRWRFLIDQFLAKPQKASGGHITNPLSKGDITFIANLEYRDGKKMNRKRQEFHWFWPNGIIFHQPRFPWNKEISWNLSYILRWGRVRSL